MKPKMQREVALDMVHESIRGIFFYATPDAAQEFEEFGEVISIAPNRYRLIVDARFDFGEVVSYVVNYAR